MRCFVPQLRHEVLHAPEHVPEESPRTIDGKMIVIEQALHLSAEYGLELDLLGRAAFTGGVLLRHHCDP